MRFVRTSSAAVTIVRGPGLIRWPASSSGQYTELWLLKTILGFFHGRRFQLSLILNLYLLTRPNYLGTWTLVPPSYVSSCPKVAPGGGSLNRDGCLSSNARYSPQQRRAPTRFEFAHS
jgi:hypothetical protein